jgi:hypothetical protein
MTEQDVKASIAAASVAAAAPPPPAPAPTPTLRSAASTPTTPATVPETRDESSSGLMWGIVGLAAVIVIVFLISRKSGSSG